MNEHTKEPWMFTKFTKADGSPIKTSQDVIDTLAHSARKSDIAELWGVTIDHEDDESAIVICYSGNGPTSQDNARRIAACVNACAGISTSYLECTPLLERLRPKVEA